MMEKNNTWIQTLLPYDKRLLTYIYDQSPDTFHKDQCITFHIFEIPPSNYNDIEHEATLHFANSSVKIVRKPDPEDQTMLALQITDPHYIIQDGSYQRDTQFLRHLAERNGAYYDGWSIVMRQD